MTSLTIQHTDAEGTVLVGTTSGDGSAPLLKAVGWRWGRSIGLWFVPRSRNQPPRRGLIARSGEALEAAGFAVQVSINAVPQDRQQVQERLTQQADRRTEKLAGRAERESAQAQQRRQAGHELADRIPFGQPILAGHHSQPRAERDADRIRGHLDASVEHQRRADQAARAAQVAATSTGARNNPGTVANRIERLRTQIRRAERELAKAAQGGISGRQDVQRLRERLEHDQADLQHWQQVRAQQIASAVATAYGQDRVAAGDKVKIRGQWRTVARANLKTVSVQTGDTRTGTVPWHQVQDHRAAAAATG